MLDNQSLNSTVTVGGRNKRSETSGEAAERRCSSLRVQVLIMLKLPTSSFQTIPSSKSLFGHITSLANVGVPASFIKSCIEGQLEKQRVMLQVENRLWPVNLNPHSKVSGLLCRGWIAFAREHDLKTGGVCVFELLEKKAKNIILKVHIFRCD
ncbi:hypothetical protein ACLB2K_063082 [Fragaria x ananassa]